MATGDKMCRCSSRSMYRMTLRMCRPMSSSPYSGCTLFTFDANGDGLDDLGCATTNGPITYYSHNGAAQPPDLLSSVTDGYGNSASPTYASLVRGNYTEYSDAVYPQKNY